MSIFRSFGLIKYMAHGCAPTCIVAYVCASDVLEMCYIVLCNVQLRDAKLGRYGRYIFAILSKAVLILFDYAWIGMRTGGTCLC